jgi:23S rRNA pseudouridine1911/1915/1917 synthase
VSDTRSLPVPDGLAGERVDAGLARLLGLSRSVTAQLAEDGQVLLDGVVVAKSARLRGGAWLEVTLPTPDDEPDDAPPEPVEGLQVVHDDDDLVVVDKPVGVAAHPSPGWTGPTVVGGLAAAGLDGGCARSPLTPMPRSPSQPMRTAAVTMHESATLKIG